MTSRVSAAAAARSRALAAGGGGPPRPAAGASCRRSAAGLAGLGSATRPAVRLGDAARCCGCVAVVSFDAEGEASASGFWSAGCCRGAVATGAVSGMAGNAARSSERCRTTTRATTAAVANGTSHCQENQRLSTAASVCAGIAVASDASTARHRSQSAAWASAASRARPVRAPSLNAASVSASRHGPGPRPSARDARFSSRSNDSSLLIASYLERSTARSLRPSSRPSISCRFMAPGSSSTSSNARSILALLSCASSRR